MNILVTGASGFIGSALVARLRKRGHRVVPLRRASVTREAEPSWSPQVGQIHIKSADPLDAVVHLAGENIAQRWTTAAKARIRASCVAATRLLCEALVRLPQSPRVLICASATGLYGDRGDEVIDERSTPDTGFLPEVCQAWEAAAAPARQRGIRMMHLRLAIVLARDAGALAKVLPLFRLGLGGRLGTGRQYWSWIALDDLLRVVELALADEKLSGAVNAVSPGPVTNAGSTEVLACALRRPAFLPMPVFAVKLSFGQMGRAALVASARVQPACLLENKFEFRFPQIDAALKQVFDQPRQMT